MRITKVYTKTGDGGNTRLAKGEDVRKSHPRIICQSSIDETNSSVGAALSFPVCEELQPVLKKVQQKLFDIGGELSLKSSLPTRITEKDIIELEHSIDHLNSSLPPLKEFILPGGSQAASTLHLARSICRRAECDLVSLDEIEKVPGIILKYVNRLSDFLFVSARFQNKKDQGKEESWEKEN